MVSRAQWFWTAVSRRLRRQAGAEARSHGALEEAYAALESGGDIRADPSSGRTFCQVTRKGHARLQAASMPNPRRVTFARRVLERISLHPSLQTRGIDDLFRQGKYETALRDGATYREDAIRSLGNFTNADVGTKLTGKAFSATGPLADPNLVPGERDGLAAQRR